MENQERTTKKPTNTKSFEIDHKRNNVTVILFRKRIFLFALDKETFFQPSCTVTF